MPTAVNIIVASSGGDYASLSAAEADNFGAAGADLVSNDENVICTCEAFSDTSAVAINGMVTDAIRNLVIRPAAGAEAQIPYSSSTYRLECSSGDRCLRIQDQNVTVEKIQVQPIKTSGTSPRDGVQIASQSSGSNIVLDGLVIKSGINSGNGNGSMGIENVDSDTRGTIRNCFVYDFIYTGMVGYRNTGSSAVMYWYNNTAINCLTGFYTNSSNIHVVNNGYESQGLASANGFSGTFNSASDYNASDISSDAPGSNAQTGNPTFVDEASDDFHLDASDTLWKGNGTDLSAVSDFPFSVDFDGETRSSWDIGSDEYVSVGLTDVISDLDIRHAILNNAISDVDLRHDILNAVEQDVQIAWDLIMHAVQDTTLSWDVFNAVTADLEAQWNIGLTVSQDMQLGWNVLNNAQADLDLRWDIHQAIVSSLDMRWNILQHITSDLDIRNDIANAVLGELNTQWDVLTNVSADADLRWDTLSMTENSLTLQWSVDGQQLAPITILIVPAEVRTFSNPENRRMNAPVEQRVHNTH
ncbi:MAG: hypothetical protein GKR93_11960 [Gammaproteobacteria bacterium]|nr:hypothetical protein [Gammaproteobacteria bacterium]